MQEQGGYQRDPEAGPDRVVRAVRHEAADRGYPQHVRLSVVPYSRLPAASSNYINRAKYRYDAV